MELDLFARPSDAHHSMRRAAGARVTWPNGECQQHGLLEQETFMPKHRAQPFIQYGCVMKGYVLVPEAPWKKTAVLMKAFAASRAYIAMLKPKPTTRSKACKKKAAKKAARKPAR
jgi:hypothetical protein